VKIKPQAKGKERIVVTREEALGLENELADLAFSFPGSLPPHLRDLRRILHDRRMDLEEQ
jgi:hypothetical protein